MRLNYAAVLAAAVTLPLAALPALAAGTTMTFDADKVNGGPAGMTCVLAGKGAPGEWKIMANADAKSNGGAGNNMLAQVGTDDREIRYPVCVADAVTAADVDVSVRFKPISGDVDQAAGLVWRYQDKDNFYIVRANALENNVVLYKHHKGRRSDLPLMGKGRTYGAKAPVPRGKWSTLRVSARGDVFTVFLNGKELYKVQDRTFTKAGKAGVWTKADSVTYFDDLTIVPK